MNKQARPTTPRVLPKQRLQNVLDVALAIIRHAEGRGFDPATFASRPHKSIHGARPIREEDGSLSVSFALYKPDRPSLRVNAWLFAALLLGVAFDPNSSFGDNPKEEPEGLKFYPYARVADEKFPLGRLAAACAAGERYDESPNDHRDLRRESLSKRPAAKHGSKYQSTREDFIREALAMHAKHAASAPLSISAGDYEALLRKCFAVLDALHRLGKLR